MGILIHEEKYFSEIHKKYSMDACSFSKLPKGFKQNIFSNQLVNQSIKTNIKAW